MIIQPDLWRRIETGIAERREQQVKVIVKGGCKTLESYADHVGFVRALDWVISYAEELSKPEPEEEKDEE